MDFRTLRTTVAAAWKRHTEPVETSSIAAMRILAGLSIFSVAMKLLEYEILLWGTQSTTHFKYFGFSWVQPWPGENGPALHMVVLGAFSLLFTIGWKARWTGAATLLLFTHLFLLDRAFYLNHFYLMILLTFLITAFPSGGRFAVRGTGPRYMPRGFLWVLRLQLFIVYFYAGLAKLNADWLSGAPLDLWLAEASAGTAFFPPLSSPATAVVAAYAAMVFDLVVPIVLLTRWRLAGFVAAFAFHVFNHFAWNIGVFPFFVTAATTLFFAPDWPSQVEARISRRFGRTPKRDVPVPETPPLSRC